MNEIIDLIKSLQTDNLSNFYYNQTDLFMEITARQRKLWFDRTTVGGNLDLLQVCRPILSWPLCYTVVG